MTWLTLVAEILAFLAKLGIELGWFEKLMTRKAMGIQYQASPYNKRESLLELLDITLQAIPATRPFRRAFVRGLIGHYGCILLGKPDYSATTELKGLSQSAD